MNINEVKKYPFDGFCKYVNAKVTAIFPNKGEQLQRVDFITDDKIPFSLSFINTSNLPIFHREDVKGKFFSNITFNNAADERIFAPRWAQYIANVKA